MLEPKKTKYRRHHRGNRRGMAKGGDYVAFGSYGLKAIEEALTDPEGKEVFVDMDLREGALKSLNRMLEFSATLQR